jgi:hypothetical protein
MNDLTARHRRALEIPVAKIIAVALGLFFAAFVLWAIVTEDRLGGQPVAVAPADLQHIAKKTPPVIAVPGTTATLPAAPPAPAKAPNDHHCRRQDRDLTRSGGCGATTVRKPRHDRSTAKRSTARSTAKKALIASARLVLRPG